MKIIIKESKIKEVIKKKLGIDLTDRIKRIERYYDLPMYFQMAIPRYMFIEYLNQFGPMYLFNGNTDSYLYQEQDGRELIANSDDKIISYSDLMEELGIEKLGLTIDQVIDIYLDEDSN